MDSKVSEKDMREVYFQAFGKEYDSANRKQAPLPLEIAYFVAINKLKREGKYTGGGEITDDIYFQSVNHFIYFCMNYPNNFLDAFGSLKTHLSNKFKDYYNKYGVYGVMIKFYTELDKQNRRILTDYSLKNYKGTPISSDIYETEYLNCVNHFVYFCFNFPDNFMDAFSSHLKVHLSSKWTNAYEKKGSIGAMIYFWSELDNENRKKLANWSKNNYTGTKLYEVGGALGDVAGMLPSPLPMSTIQAMAKGGILENAKTIFSIHNDYYGNLELGFYDIEFKNEKGTSISNKSFYKLDDAFETLFEYLKSENGQYIIEKEPKSNFYIEERSYDGKSTDYDGYPNTKYKTIFKISSKKINELIKSNNFENGGGVDGVKRFDVDFYDDLGGNIKTSVELIIRADSLDNAIEDAIKKAYELKKNYIEFYHRGFFLGSINFANSKDFIEGRFYNKFISNDLYADGGGVDDFKMSNDEMTTYEKSNHIHYNPMNSRWEVTKNGENKEFWNQEQAEKYAGFEFDYEKDSRYSRKRYEALFGYADGGNVGKLNTLQKRVYESVKNRSSKSITTYNLPNDTRKILEELYYMDLLNRSYIKDTQEAEYTLKFANGGGVESKAEKLANMIREDYQNGVKVQVNNDYGDSADFSIYAPFEYSFSKERAKEINKKYFNGEGTISGGGNEHYLDVNFDLDKFANGGGVKTDYFIAINNRMFDPYRSYYRVESSDIFNGKQVYYDLDGEAYIIDENNYTEFKSGDMALQSSQHDMVVPVYFNENDEDADNEDFVNNTHKHVKLIPNFNKYYGEWHKDKSDAEKELKSLNEKFANGGGIDYYELQDLKNKESVLEKELHQISDNQSDGWRIDLALVRSELESVREEISKLENKYADGGGVDNLFLSDSEIDKLNKLEVYTYLKKIDPLGNFNVTRATTKSLREVAKKIKHNKKSFSDGGEIKEGDRVLWRGNDYILSKIKENMVAGFRDTKYHLTSTKKGVEDANLDSLRDVTKVSFKNGGDVELFRPTKKQMDKMKKEPFNPNVSMENHKDFSKLGLDKTEYSSKLMNIGRWVDVSDEKGLVHKLPYKIISLQKNYKDEIIYRGANQHNDFGLPISEGKIKRWLTENEALKMYNDNINYYIDNAYNYADGGGVDVDLEDDFKKALVTSNFTYYTDGSDGIRMFRNSDNEELTDSAFAENSLSEDIENNDIVWASEDMQYNIDAMREEFSKGGSTKVYKYGGEIEERVKEKLSRNFALPFEVVVYVPSTQDADKTVSKEEFMGRIAEVETYLAKLFGGFSSNPVDGGYNSDEKGLIKEDVFKVFSFASRDGFEPKIEELVIQIKKWCKVWGQEAIGLEFEGDLFYVEA